MSEVRLEQTLLVEAGGELARPPPELEDQLALVARLLDGIQPPTQTLYLIHDRSPTSATIPIDENGIVIGRSKGSGYSTPDDKTLSGDHFRVRLEDGEGWIEDLQSRNGTCVGSARVTRAILRSGDVIRAGRQRFVFIDSR